MGLLEYCKRENWKKSEEKADGYSQKQGKRDFEKLTYEENTGGA